VLIDNLLILKKYKSLIFDELIIVLSLTKFINIIKICIFKYVYWKNYFTINLVIHLLHIVSITNTPASRFMYLIKLKIIWLLEKRDFHFSRDY
jgi:hypothetical protein